MELLMVGSMLLCALVGTAVGLKLLGIAARTRKLPEFAIGAGLLAYAGVSQPALLAYQALGDEVSLGVRMGFAVLRVLAIYATLLALSLFTWRVFGSESRWRQALAALVAVAASISAALTIRGTWQHLSSDAFTPLYWRLGMSPHFVLAFGWMSLESLRYHALLRKRLALGLADPVVANRFFVWGAGEGVSSLLVLALIVVMCTGREIAASDPVVAWFVTLTGLVNALVWWLSFAPPAAYLNWIRGTAAAAGGEG
jgi:hypothetical protein